MDDFREPIDEVSLCLSGGGARGPFHIGVLAYLEDKNIAIKAISGTSIGALIGSSYASGVKPAEIFEIISSKSFKKMIRFNFSFKSLFKLALDYNLVEKLLKVKTFEELPLPNYVTYFALDDGKITYAKEGEVLKSILRSIAIAPAFETIEDEETKVLYGDGGVVNNLPVEPLLEYPYPIVSVGLHPNPVFKKRGLIAVLKRVVFLAWHRNITEAIEKSDIYITSERLTGYSLISFKNQEELYQLGYASAKEAFEAYYS